MSHADIVSRQFMFAFHAFVIGDRPMVKASRASTTDLRCLCQGFDLGKQTHLTQGTVAQLCKLGGYVTTPAGCF